MKIFSNNCPQCSFIWAVADRLPNYCPECGYKLMANSNDFFKLKRIVKTIEVNEVSKTEKD